MKPFGKKPLNFGSPSSRTSASRRSGVSVAPGQITFTVVPEAVTEARALIAKKYGAQYVPSAPRTYTNTAANAQTRPSLNAP